MFGRLAIRFDHRVECGAVSHRGLVRTDNEDAWHADADAGLFVLADGMGGQAAGEIASRLAVKTVSDHLAKNQGPLRAYATNATPTAREDVWQLLEAAVEAAHQAVIAEAKARPECKGMGATLDVLLFSGNRAFLAHVGDARVYLVRPSAAIQLTHDHDTRTIIGVRGSMPPPMRMTVPNRLLNAIGVEGAIACDRVSVEIAQGDRLILCTDGVHQMIGDEARIGVRGGAPAATASALVEAALQRGGRDNATAVVVDVREPRTTRKSTVPARESVREMELAMRTPLLLDLPPGDARRVLSATVEVDLPPGRIGRIVTVDRVAYVVLEGEVKRSDGVVLGAGAFLYAESLVDARRPTTYEALTRVRALRLRADDFREVCDADSRLAAALLLRLARHLAHVEPK